MAKNPFEDDGPDLSALRESAERPKVTGVADFLRNLDPPSEEAPTGRARRALKRMWRQKEE